MALLDGKVVVVTGAGRGIGRAIATTVAKEGGRVLVADNGVTLRGTEPGPQVAEDVVRVIENFGGEATAFTDDVTSMTGAADAVDVAVTRWGAVDGAVCCAGILRHAPFHELGDQDFDMVIQAHLKGHFTMFQSVFKHLMARGSAGSLIGISSGYLHADPMRSAYRAAKAGVIALSKSAALAGAPVGIRVNIISPLANTRMTEASHLQFDSDPEDVAPIAAYLLSDQSQHINGEVIHVAGRTIGTWDEPRLARSARHWSRWGQEEIAEAMPWLTNQNVTM